ncbi:MAG: ribonuclease H family protein [Eubacteriales bacterium]|nr:ribonuclease H family protein [Eubacteriales bacterium]
MKYYAVQKGREPGIYTTWKDCQAQVYGFAGALFKSFPTLAEAERFMNHALGAEEENNQNIEAQLQQIDTQSVIAFVDGSYQHASKRFSYGAVLFTSEGKHTLSQAYDDPQKISARNVAGEIAGVQAAILWAVEKGKKKISVYYDYEGIDKWARGIWKTNQILTQEYKAFIDEYAKHIQIQFCHVKAHTGITYNEEADQLAKEALC